MGLLSNRIMHLAMLLIVVCSHLTLVVHANEGKTKPHKPLLGAVVALLKGNQKGDFNGVINRNKSILKFMWKNSSVVSETNTNPDIVLFYENELSTEMRQYIQDATPEMKMKYVPVQFDGFGVFEDATNTTGKLVNPLCIPTFWSKQFKVGYRNMCRFWFIGMFDYVQEYDWIFRLDPDCELVGPIHDVMPENVMGGVPITEHNNHHHVFISSPGWLALHRQKYDKVATTRDGDVVFGLGPFVRNFANNYGLNHSFIDSMYAPYTNAMFINLRWMRGSGHHHNIDPTAGSGGNSSAAAHHHDGPAHRMSHPAIIRQFLKEVDESNCIYSNRWGDMPLWGAALSLIEHTVRFLNVPYYHASHNVMIKENSRTGFFRADIPQMLVYADNQNCTLNARISVLGG